MSAGGPPCCSYRCSAIAAEGAKLGRVSAMVNSDRQKYALEMDVRCPDEAKKKKKPDEKAEKTDKPEEKAGDKQ